MSLGNPKSGFGFVSEYQVSALPWVTASTLPSTMLRYDFPWVSQYFTLQNEGSNDIKVGFTPSTSGSKYFAVKSSSSLSLDVRVKSLYLTGSSGSQFSLFVGMTSIDVTMCPDFAQHLFPTGSSLL
jgi:hypothetical protein